MENNSDRMGFALIALSVVAFVLLAVNGTLQPTVKGFFNGFKNWQTQTFDGINESNKQDVTHTAYSWSSDGSDRFTTTKPNLNLLDGTSGPFVMGYGIPNTTWDTTNQVSKISLPFTKLADEVLPQGTEFYYKYTPGVTYTQSIFISTDSPLTGTPIRFNWFTDVYGRNIVGVNNLVKVSTNIYRATSTYTWPSSNSFAYGRNADFDNLHQVFDFTKGTFLQFYKPKLEEGSLATPYMPSSSEVKPSDQPKYIGTYTDKSDSASQDPKKYTWKSNPDYHE